MRAVSRFKCRHKRLEEEKKSDPPIAGPSLRSYVLYALPLFEMTISITCHQVIEQRVPPINQSIGFQIFKANYSPPLSCSVYVRLMTIQESSEQQKLVGRLFRVGVWVSGV